MRELDLQDSKIHLNHNSSYKTEVIFAKRDKQTSGLAYEALKQKGAAMKVSN